MGGKTQHIEVSEQEIVGKDGVVRRLAAEHDDPMDRVPYWVAFTTYFGYTWLILIGFIRDVIGRKILAMCFKSYQSASDNRKGYAPLLADFEEFFQRRLYMRTHDVFDRPICSAPGPYIDVMLRKFSLMKMEQPLTGETTRCLNLGSYNYLGFSVNGGADPLVFDTLEGYSVSTCGPRTELGTAPVHLELEKTIAEFVGKPAAVVVGMGFATNSTLIPCLLGKGGLIISDQLNHTSIVQGARCSRAKIKTFKHNDPESLEQVVRTAIAEGQPGYEAYKPWKKIVILVEGLYSMEGSICRLPPIIEIKKKYGAYLWVDEAHSIGALGKSGKGVVEYWGCDPADVDVMMGTFTKSFGAPHPGSPVALRCRGPSAEAGGCACRLGGWVRGLVRGAHRAHEDRERVIVHGHLHVAGMRGAVHPRAQPDDGQGGRGRRRAQDPPALLERGLLPRPAQGDGHACPRR